MSLILQTFRRASSRHLRADAGRRVALRVLCSLKPLYPRHPLVPHGWATVNIAKRYRVAIRCMAVVKQRIMPRAANRYYASSWVIGSHLTDMLTSRRANVAALVLLQFARQSRLTRSKLKLETRAGRGSPVHENAS